MDNLNPEDALPTVPHGAEYGRLDNGLTYYVASNSVPEMRAELLLVVKVGSILEQEGEQGVAHIIEHLAFSTTENYENHEIIRFLASIGAELGPCLNATTSEDSTVYEFSIPLDNSDVLDETISVLSEFASKIRISDGDLDKERGPIMEEYRDSRDAKGRIDDAQWRLMMEGSKYADCSFMGLEKVILNVSSDAVKQFYKKWYHMKHMAVIAVGDFIDTKRVVESIKTHFGSIVSPSDYLEIPRFEVPVHKEPRFLCYVDPEAMDTLVTLVFKSPVSEKQLVKNYRRSIVARMFHLTMNRRLNIVSQKSNRPFRSCCIYEYEPARPIKAYKMLSSCYENGVLPAMESMLSEIARVHKYGFSEQEISATRELLKSKVETAYLQRNQCDSKLIRDGYLDHFRSNEPALSIEEEYRLRQFLLPDISANEVSLYSEIFRTTHNCVIKTTEHRVGATEEDLKSVVLKINLLEENGIISKWVEEHIPEEIVANYPEPGSVKNESVYPIIGATELILSNGMRVCYKRTDFLHDRIFYSGYAYGGVSEVSESEYSSCSLAKPIAAQVGIYGYRPSMMNAMLRGKIAGLGVKIEPYTRTFDGGCASTELETALKMIYQLFVTNVLPTEQDIEDVMKSLKETVNNMERDPITVFKNLVEKLTRGSYYFNRPLEISDLQKVDASKACEFFSNCFKDPSTFVVVFVGDIDPAIAIPLILKYLGGIPLPSPSILKYNRDELSDLPFTLPTKIAREVVCTSMVEEQCIVKLCFRVEFKNENLLEKMRFVNFFSKLFELKLNQVLRFDHGKIYSCDVSLFLNGTRKFLTSGSTLGKITVEFPCNPDSYDELVDLSLKEIARLQMEGPLEEDITTLHAIDQCTRKDLLQVNECWIGQILDSYQSVMYSGNIDDSYKFQNEVHSKFWKGLTPETAKIALQTFLPFPCTKLYTAVILEPQI